MLTLMLLVLLVVLCFALLYAHRRHAAVLDEVRHAVTRLSAAAQNKDKPHDAE